MQNAQSKCLDTNNGVNLALLQIRLIPIVASIPSPAMVLFNIPIRDLLSQMKRKPININNNDVQYEALKACQDKYVKDNSIHKNLLSFPIGSKVAVQCEDGGPWMYGVTEEANNSNHSGRSYIIRVMKMLRLIM